MQGQECTTDVAEYPNEVPPIFDKWPIKCGDVRFCDETQHMYGLTIYWSLKQENHKYLWK